MKKIALIFIILILNAGLCIAQQSVFVNALGNDDNSGRSEDTPFRTISRAMEEIRISGINRITVIGYLDAESEIKNGNDSVFVLDTFDRSNELIITGMRGASGASRAVLSGRGSGLPVLGVSGANTKIRLENIEITGGESIEGTGLLILNGASVTLGPGAVLRDNQTGVKLILGSCIIDGGEIRDNSVTGIVVTNLCVLTMRGGTVRNNQGSGVLIQRNGRFSMTGGTITGNVNPVEGAGVYVQSGGRFDQTAGTINGNHAPQHPDVYREIGAFGNDLTMTSARPVSFRSENDPAGTSKGLSFNVPFLIGLYGQGWRENLASLGLVLQLGFEVDFARAFTIAVSGEASGGFGYPYLLEGNLIGSVEMYFANKRIGIGGGYGINTRTMYFEDVIKDDAIEINFDQELININFYRFMLIFRGPVKTTLFANYYNKENWDDIENWGFGVQIGWYFRYQGRQ
jgi:hypothetical protein